GGALVVGAGQGHRHAVDTGIGGRVENTVVLGAVVENHTRHLRRPDLPEVVVDAIGTCSDRNGGDLIGELVGQGAAQTARHAVFAVDEGRRHAHARLGDGVAGGTAGPHVSERVRAGLAGD